jgi:tungstate transport system ATP-binding protein
MTEDIVYRLKNVSRAYEGRTVVMIDRLDIRAGEILAIVGPSGAGKSTLLRLLNFLEPPTSGQLRYRHFSNNGAGVPSLDVRRQVTTVFQRPALLNRSVAANVAYGLRLRGRRGAGGQVQSALEMVGLAELSRAAARTLSGGEAQRVALARALIIEPRVLLLDEPTANLDPYNVNLIEQIITHVNRERGTTVVLVTHNVFQARRLAQRVALMLEGRIVEITDTHTFFEIPSDARTAAFVRGDMVY